MSEKICMMVIDALNGVKFDHEKKYYLAGPMSGYPGFNYDSFGRACEVLRDNKVLINSPHEIDHQETDETRGAKPYEEYMQAGMAVLRESAGIILIAGWPRSTGAVRELQLAIELNLPVYFFYETADVAVLTCMNKEIPQ